MNTQSKFNFRRIILIGNGSKISFLLKVLYIIFFFSIFEIKYGQKVL